MAETSPTPIRRRVLFHGRVQGVGFRYTTASIARRHPVVGFVRNLPDGSVELVAEATPPVLDQFLADIGRIPYDEVESTRQIREEKVPNHDPCSSESLGLRSPEPMPNQALNDPGLGFLCRVLVRFDRSDGIAQFFSRHRQRSTVTQVGGHQSVNGGYDKLAVATRRF